jgi:hypothetical protein
MRVSGIGAYLAEQSGASLTKESNAGSVSPFPITALRESAYTSLASRRTTQRRFRWRSSRRRWSNSLTGLSCIGSWPDERYFVKRIHSPAESLDTDIVRYYCVGGCARSHCLETNSLRVADLYGRNCTRHCRRWRIVGPFACRSLYLRTQFNY